MASGTYLVLGAAGLVGYQAAFRIARDLAPETIVVAARRRDRAEAAAAGLAELAPAGVDVVAEWGDLFVCAEYADTPRRELLTADAPRAAARQDLLGPLDAAYDRSRLAWLIGRHRPDVVVDAVNTATAISYQDVYAAAAVAERDVASLLSGEEVPSLARDVEALLLTMPLPQLIRHVLILHRSLREAGTRLYLKVGTTGTGGLGLDVPFTHSEDRPSAQLLTKAAVAFAHTGLLFLMARTAGGPAVKEVKPGALIGYADVADRVVHERGTPVARYRARAVPLRGPLTRRLDPAGFDRGPELHVPVVDTGENGVFARGEFAVITAPGHMEFVTPEEIAALCVAEIRGANTGRDVIAALDGAVLGPSYRGGALRARVLGELAALEEVAEIPSVALGQLGPPELGKLLWEAWILGAACGDPGTVLRADPADIAAQATAVLDRRPELRDAIVSVGLPVVAAAGDTLWRGPFVRIPEVGGTRVVDDGTRDAWADRGWVDLRPANWARWQHRLRAMRAAEPGKAQRGSAGVEALASDGLDPGAVVAWVVACELGGTRAK